MLISELKRVAHLFAQPVGDNSLAVQVSDGDGGVATASFTITGPGGPYTGSGVSALYCGLAPGDYTITYGDVSGYTTPVPETQTLTAGAYLVFSGDYIVSDARHFVIGKGTDTVDTVELYNMDGTFSGSFTAYAASGSVNVAAGDLDGDGNDEILTVPGVGNAANSELRVFDSSGTEDLALRITPFGATFDMGVASEDLDGDGRDEVIVWSGGSGQNVRLRVYTYDTNTQVLVETGININTGVGNSVLRITAGDMDGNGTKDLITVVGKNNGATSAWTWYIWNVNSSGGVGSWSLSLGTKFGYNVSSTRDVVVAAGDTDGDGIDEMPTAVWNKTLGTRAPFSNLCRRISSAPLRSAFFLRSMLKKVFILSITFSLRCSLGIFLSLINLSIAFFLGSTSSIFLGRGAACFV